MANKIFAERLNKELDNIGMPTLLHDRIEAFSKLIKIPKFKAEAYINGIYLPSNDLLILLGEEFEVNPEWLAGKSEKRARSASETS
jgi:hypothetical protein